MTSTVLKGSLGYDHNHESYISLHRDYREPTKMMALVVNDSGVRGWNQWDA